MSLKYQILTRFNHVHVKRHDEWRKTTKIDFKTSNIVVQYVFKKMMSIWKRVDIVNFCVDCQCVIYVILCIKSSVSGECCIRYYSVVSSAISKENAYRLSKVLHESVAWNLLRYAILEFIPLECGNISSMASQITGNSTVCWKAMWPDHQFMEFHQYEYEL